MSGSTFAARFKELVGEPPQRHFTRLRINAAAARLRTGVDTLSAAAGAGYRSAAAFAKSFKRHLGTTPGEYRDFGAGSSSSGVTIIGQKAYLPRLFSPVRLASVK
jgi:AraC-like DNA-binding protein